MSRVGFRLDKKGVGDLLKSADYAAVINKVAEDIAADLGEDAEVSEYTTDRKAASVSVPAHLQASDGALTRAAARHGLEVRAK